MMRVAMIVALLVPGAAWEAARAGDSVRVGPIVYVPAHVIWLQDLPRVHVRHHSAGPYGFYGHRWYPHRYRHDSRFYGHRYPFLAAPPRYVYGHGLRFHPRRDLHRSYRRYGTTGSFFSPPVWYDRHRHDVYCGH